MPARVTTPLVALALLLALSARAGGEAVAGYVSAAVADAARPREQVERDAWRKPAELLAFAGVKPGDKVADFMPGNAYFTRLLSPLVAQGGRVYAFLPAEQLAH